MKLIEKDVFLRSFPVLSDQSYDLLIGSGASVNSGIPTGGELVWYFKREILNSRGIINGKKFTDLKIEDNKRIIQQHFDQRGDKNIPNPYSYYFEECYPNPNVRKDFLTNIVRDKKPSIGFHCLASLVENRKLDIVWTSNFDDLIEKAISAHNYQSCQIVSPENANSVKNFRADIPTIVKLHGDFRYDPLQNTSQELQELEENLHGYMLNSSKSKGLLVVGYSGSDESIMKTIMKSLEDSNAFPNGLIWAVPKGLVIKEELNALMEKANKQNGRSGFIIIDNFDYFMYELYRACNISNESIDSIAKDRFEQRKNFKLTQNQSEILPVLLNAIKAKDFPKSVFSSKTIVSGEGKWKKLREFTNNTNIAAAFGKKDTLWLFGNENEIKSVFKDLIIDELKISDIPENVLYHTDSFYIGLLYDLFLKSLVNDYGFEVYSRGRRIRKFFLKEYTISNDEIESIKKRNKRFAISSDIDIFEAFELKLEFVNSELFILINPTIQIQLKSGGDPSKATVQYLTNAIISNRYNEAYGKKLDWWLKVIKQRNSRLIFRLGDFEIKLYDYYSTAAKKVLDNLFCFEGYKRLDEPYIYFHHHDETNKSIHPINGLKIFSPLENSYGGNSSTQKINLAIISPDFGFEKLKSHIDSLLNPASPIWEKEYLKDYTGFDDIYKKHLIIPNSTQSEYVITLKDNDVKQLNAFQFYDYIKNKIDILATKNTEIDCTLIYIPDEWKRFREFKTEKSYYDLHDSLKLYCVKKGLRIQLIEDKSINYADQAKIRWWLSLGIYVKSNGTPWKIKTSNLETAFVGLGYAVRQNAKNKVVLGSSQLFDGNGNGLKFLLQPIEKPIFYNRNPFMSKDDAFRLVSNIRNTYHKIDPVIGLKKLIIHKTSHFTGAEMEGIANALEGIDEVELLQIQQFSNWRGLKLNKKNNGKHYFNGYPIERGTIIQLDDYNFLLWTHGVVLSNELNGKYYQGKRGIPAPLLVKRFRGTDPIESVANDILKLTKVNWNGAELYKTFPVTIDFAKRLSVMGKQLEELGTKPHDFRYFI
ncbi:SIR2 family protein [Candidatus Dojkabacteria bacterium]|nr:SIR2 family protein [Candidatus Dojkabacteria bacterium]